MRLPALWKANIIAFISSFCVMVVELIASRILAPYIGVSLYTWTSIIGIILSGIALGNYIGGKLADRYASAFVLALIFFAGSLATIAILPMTRLVSYATWFSDLPLLLGLVLKITFIFFIPAIILSMVSPMVIKLTLGDLGKTGGVVGTIYAVSTAGSIAGTFMTGFYFILWFGIRQIIWLVAAALLLVGVLAWFSWKTPGRWRLSRQNMVLIAALVVVVVTALYFFQRKETWQESFTAESNYYSIRVFDENNYRVLSLDRLIHSYVRPDDPLALKYDYLKTFADIIEYAAGQNPAPRTLHLGGGGYSLPRYLETAFPQSTNEVVEIDPAVTRVAHQELGLPADTTVKTINQDARLFLMRREAAEKYDFVIGDVFNDTATPYHLTTLEFDRLVKTHMTVDGIYLINIIDDYSKGRYLPSFINTLQKSFRYVYLFSPLLDWQYAGRGTFVIAATDNPLNLVEYEKSAAGGPRKIVSGHPLEESKLREYLAARNPILLTDDYAPTDILVAPLFR